MCTKIIEYEYPMQCIILNYAKKNLGMKLLIFDIIAKHNNNIWNLYKGAVGTPEVEVVMH